MSLLRSLLKAFAPWVITSLRATTHMNLIQIPLLRVLDAAQMDLGSWGGLDLI